MGTWRTYASLDPDITAQGTTTLPPPRRMWFLHQNVNEWCADTQNQYDASGLTPGETAPSLTRRSCPRSSPPRRCFTRKTLPTSPDLPPRTFPMHSSSSERSSPTDPRLSEAHTPAPRPEPSRAQCTLEPPRDGGGSLSGGRCYDTRASSRTERSRGVSCSCMHEGSLLMADTSAKCTRTRSFPSTRWELMTNGRRTVA